MPTVFEILLETTSICLFHFRFAESMTPKNLVSNWRFKLASCIRILISGSFLLQNMIYEVLVTFSDKRLVLNQLFTISTVYDCKQKLVSVVVLGD